MIVYMRISKELERKEGGRTGGKRRAGKVGRMDGEKMRRKEKERSLVYTGL